MVFILPFSMQIRLQRITISPSAIGTPILAASMYRDLQIHSGHRSPTPINWQFHYRAENRQAPYATNRCAPFSQTVNSWLISYLQRRFPPIWLSAHQPSIAKYNNVFHNLFINFRRSDRDSKSARFLIKFSNFHNVLRIDW